jgi:hypothetical protein
VLGGEYDILGRGSKEVHAGFWSESLKVRDSLKDQHIDGNVILKRCRLDSPCTGTNDGPL